MWFINNEVDFFIMNRLLKIEYNFFGKFVNNIRGNVGKKVFNGAIRDVGGTLIEVRKEFVYVFGSLFTLIGSVWEVIILNGGDNGGFSFLFVRREVV